MSLVHTGKARRLGGSLAALLVMLAAPAAAIAGPRAAKPAASPVRTEAFLAEKRATAASLANRDLPAAKVLPTRPRQQMTDYNCAGASAQVIINYTRGVDSTNNDGEADATNWVTQRTLARWMNTDVVYGTGGKGVAKGLNQAGGLRKPTPDWVYTYEATGGPKAFHDKVVTDVAIYDMPLVIAVNPHVAHAGVHHLVSWPADRPLARHWIAIRGYEGLWGSPSPLVHYSDSSGGYGGGTGNYWDLSEVVHRANAYNYGRIVW